MTKDIAKYLSKILASTEFKNSKKYHKLLEYLVKSSYEGNVPKEVTIAYEVFHVDADDGSHDSNIRGYIFNLRKKLDSYYVREGKDDAIRFVIPKGRYKVEFVQKDNSNKLKKKRWLQLLLGLAVLLVLSNAFFIFEYLHNKYKQEPAASLKYIWNGFLSSDKPTLVVIGDYYLVKDDKFRNRIRYSRDVRINSDYDFKLFQDKYPEEGSSYYKTRHTLLGKFAPICINEINKLFASGNNKIEVIMASDFQYRNLQGNNVIYIGSFKSLGNLKELLTKANFEYVIYPNELKFHQLSNDSVYHYYSTDSDVDHAYESDYTTVTKFPVTDKTNILCFISTRDIGLIATVKYFCNPESAQTIKNQFSDIPADSLYFETCFKVQGLYRNTIDIELLQTNILPARRSYFFK